MVLFIVMHLCEFTWSAMVTHTLQFYDNYDTIKLA